MDGAALMGRVLLASIFIVSGIMKFMDPSGTAAMIAERGLPAPDVLAYGATTIETFAGVAVAIGWGTRLAALILAAFTVAAAMLFHNFWAFSGAEATLHMQGFMKNIAIAGGFLMLVAFGPGRYAFGAARARRFEDRTVDPDMKLNIA